MAIVKKVSMTKETFARAYAATLDVAKSAQRAGVVTQTGYKYLNDPQVVMRVQERREEINKASEADAFYVRKRLLEIDQMDVADILDDDGAFLPMKQWPKVWRTTISSVKQTGTGAVLSVEIKWPDKLKNLELLGRHVDVSAWEERQKIEEGGAPPLAITFEVAPAKADVQVTRGE